MNRKRSAAEPPEVLLGYEPTVAPHAKRPKSVALGAALVFGRAVAGVLWFIGLTLEWGDIVDEFQLDGEESAILYWFAAIVNLGSVLVLALFAWLIWRGNNAARVITMLVLTVSILTAATGHFVAGEAVTLQTTLLTVALDILVLLALSSRDARAWARRPRRSS